MLYYSENILKYSAEAVTNLTSNSSISGKLTIGANESFSVARLPTVFKHFLSHEVVFPDLIIETLLSEQISVATSPMHPFCTKDHITINDFINQVLILTQKNCSFRSMIDTLIKQAQIHPHAIIEINNIEAIKQPVANGLGITIIPRISIVHEIEQGLLTELTWSGPQ